MPSRNPIGRRGYKKGLILIYINERVFGVTPGECHYVDNPEELDDSFLKVNETITVNLDQVRSNVYQFVYIERLSNGINIFYDKDYPVFSLERAGYYHVSRPARCIGSFLVGDGYILPFEIIGRLHHNYDDVKGEIYRLTRKTNELNDPSWLWREDRLPPVGERDDFPFTRTTWKEFKFKCPFWGYSWETCNFYPRLILFIASDTLDNSNLYTRSSSSLVDEPRNLTLPEKNILHIESGDTTSDPNRLWDLPRKPITHEFIASVNEYGECQFRSDLKQRNYTELSTIGYVLPNFIGTYPGFFPKEYINVFRGLELRCVDKTLYIAPGMLYFKEPAGLGYTNDVITVEIGNELNALIWNYVYISCPEESSILQSSNIHISVTLPTRTNYGWYKPRTNLRCIGAIRTDRDNNIISFRSNVDYPPDECLYSCNNEVRFILENSHNHNPYQLEKLIRRCVIDYNLRGHDHELPRKSSPVVFKNYDHHRDMDLYYHHWDIDQSFPYNNYYPPLPIDFNVGIFESDIPIYDGPYDMPLQPKDWWYYRTDLERKQKSKFIDYEQFWKPTYYVWGPYCQFWEPRPGFSWDCFDPSRLGLDDNHIVYKSIIDEDWVDCVPIKYAHPKGFLRFEQFYQTFGVILDEWDICDEHLSDNGAYLIARDPTHPIVCDISFGPPIDQCTINPFDDDAVLDYLGFRDTTSFIDFVEQNPLEHYDPKSYFSIERLGLTFKGARIKRHPNRPGLLISKGMYYDRAPNIGAVLDIYKPIKTAIPYYNLDHDVISNLDYWWDEITTHDTTSLLIQTRYFLRDDNLDERYFRLYDDSCNALEIKDLVKTPIVKGISFVIDFCNSKYHTYHDTTSFGDTTTYYDCTSYIDSTSNYQLINNWGISFFEADTTSRCHKIPDISTKLYQFINDMPTTKFGITDVAYPESPYMYYMLGKFSQTIKDNIENFPDHFCYTNPDYIAALRYDRDSLNDCGVDEKYTILIGKNYQPCESNFLAEQMQYPQPHPYILFDIIHYAIEDRIRYYAITEEYSQDLDVLCRSTGGLYVFGSFDTLSNMLNVVKQHILQNNKYRYTVYFKPHMNDGLQHTLTIKTVGHVFNQVQMAYKPIFWHNYCDFTGIPIE